MLGCGDVALVQLISLVPQPTELLRHQLLLRSPSSHIMSDAGKQTFAEKVAQNTDGDTGPNPSTAFSQSPAGVSGTMGGGGSALGGATVGGYGDGGAGGLAGGIDGGTAGKSSQERKDVAGTGAGDTDNQPGDIAVGKQPEAASNQGLSGQGGVF